MNQTKRPATIARSLVAKLGVNHPDLFETLKRSAYDVSYSKREDETIYLFGDGSFIAASKKFGGTHLRIFP